MRPANHTVSHFFHTFSSCSRALEVHAKHANTLYNYAVMLDTHLKRKEEAEGLYRRALEVEPRHAFALYNLAVLLEERYSVDLIAQAAASAEIASTMGPNIAAAMEDPDFKEKDLKKREEILGLYQRAVEADPRDTTTLADYGRCALSLSLSDSNIFLLCAIYNLLGTVQVHLGAYGERAESGEHPGSRAPDERGLRDRHLQPRSHFPQVRPRGLC